MLHSEVGNHIKECRKLNLLLKSNLTSPDAYEADWPGDTPCFAAFELNLLERQRQRSKQTRTIGQHRTPNIYSTIKLVHKSKRARYSVTADILLPRGTLKWYRTSINVCLQDIEKSHFQRPPSVPLLLFPSQQCIWTKVP